MGNSEKKLLKTLFFFLVLGLIVVWLGFGERGFLHLYKKEKDRQAYQERIRKIEKDNQALIEEIERLNTDDTYLESVARKELGLVRDDEILYRFSTEEKSPRTSETIKQ